MQTSDPRTLLVAIVKILKKLKIPYMITGGIAVLLWGRPRFTADIDIVVELYEKDIEALRKALRFRQEVQEMPRGIVSLQAEALAEAWWR